MIVVAQAAVAMRENASQATILLLKIVASNNIYTSTVNCCVLTSMKISICFFENILSDKDGFSINVNSVRVTELVYCLPRIILRKMMASEKGKTVTNTILKPEQYPIFVWSGMWCCSL